MIQWRSCSCTRPRVFADQPETCHRCGYSPRMRVTASTRRLALAIAEVVMGRRPLGGASKRKG